MKRKHDLNYLRDFFIKNGGTMILCEKCGGIIDFEYPQGKNLSGPSMSSNMFCNKK